MENPNEYDFDPVYYCKDCLSLCIMSIVGLDYCKDCGSTNIGVASNIFEWEKLYKERYNK